jgi:hypothetical protein
MTVPTLAPPNLLRQGTDPYADSGVTDARTGIVPFDLLAAEFDAATTKEYVAPFQGMFREFTAVVSVLTAGAASVELVYDEVVIATLVIPAASPPGTVVSAMIADVAPYNNNYAPLTPFQVVNAVGPTAGSIRGYVRISADQPPTVFGMDPHVP